ncbi:MAG: hypothetical protein K0B16_16345, partial [Burkholderiaceae bacterium]|nr:hypothetical protein [Burkholderiaceae bacterium]
ARSTPMMVTSFTDASFDLLGFNVQSLAHCDAVGEGGIHSITSLEAKQWKPLSGSHDKLDGSVDPQFAPW